MRNGLIAAALFVAFVPAVRAESPRVGIVSARVGFPDARDSEKRITKFAAWSPIEVELAETGSHLVVESPDADGVLTVLKTKLEPGATRAITYVRPAASGEITLHLEDTSGKMIGEPFRIRNLRPKDPLTYVVLSLGSKLPNFDLPKPTTGTGSTEADANGPLRGGRVELVAIEDAAKLPVSGIGYDAADLVILSASSPAFLSALGADSEKWEALVEWVERGGRLVVAGSTKDWKIVDSLLPVGIASVSQVSSLPLYWSARETSQSTSLTGNLAVKSGTFPVAKFAPRPGHAPRIVIPPASRPTELKDAVAVQRAFGLGRVTLIGFDLDRSPFTEFPRQAEFWDWVLREGGASRASVGSEGKTRIESSGPTDEEDEVAVALRTHADTFEAIPVVSFGSVAFLIVLYILLIGPIEYWFLKRILGRLELTWITFPIIVVTVCVAASLSASAMKGDWLRVNKIDVIDVEANFDANEGKPAGHVFGTAWFTIFSPKIDTYSPRVAPAETWLGTRTMGRTLVDWVGGPRAGRAGLLQRKYAYDSSGRHVARGLDDVPVQMWSTKSFTANWTYSMDPAAPVVESRLEHPFGDPSKAVGTFVNRMPFEAVSDCTAFYAGQAYPIGTILKGQEVRLVLDRGQPAPQWMQERGQLAELLGRGQALGAAAASSSKNAVKSTAPTTHLPLWSLLFHEAALRNEEGVIPRNASLRRLDQSWRLAPDYRDEVIVVGRVLPPHGTIDERFNGSESPTRLLLKDGKSLPGFARQETYVRLFLKVKS
ncbi:MAG: hypothetical protein U0791_00305 [Gemmataceae bacterium]